MTLLSLGILFLAFNPAVDVDRPYYVQVSAVALVFLLASRIILSYRVRDQSLDT